MWPSQAGLRFSSLRSVAEAGAANTPVRRFIPSSPAIAAGRGREEVRLDLDRILAVGPGGPDGHEILRSHTGGVGVNLVAYKSIETVSPSANMHSWEISPVYGQRLRAPRRGPVFHCTRRDK